MSRFFQPGQLFQADQSHIGASSAPDDQRFSRFGDAIAVVLETGTKIGIGGHSRHLGIVQDSVLVCESFRRRSSNGNGSGRPSMIWSGSDTVRKLVLPQYSTGVPDRTRRHHHGREPRDRDGAGGRGRPSEDRKPGRDDKVIALCFRSFGETDMATVRVRRLDPDVVERLKRRAAANHRSLESEIRQILAATAEDQMAAKLESFHDLAARLRRRTEGREQAGLRLRLSGARISHRCHAGDGGYALCECGKGDPAWRRRGNTYGLHDR